MTMTPSTPAGGAVAWYAEKTGRSSFSGKTETRRGVSIEYPQAAKDEGYAVRALTFADATVPVEAVLALVEKVRSELLQIQRRATVHADDTAEDRKRYLYHCEGRATSALALLDELESLTQGEK